MQILTHTPRWVFVLFALLLVLGVQQLSPREVALRRVVLLPLAMGALSFYGLLSAFGTQPAALLAWAACAVGAAGSLLGRPLPRGLRYDAQERRLSVPGSAVPLALMMGVFFTKYAVGVILSQAPQLAHTAAFALPCAAVYGVFSGLFAGRALRLLRFVTNAAVTVHAPLV
jgi:hypothetical protein